MLTIEKFKGVNNVVPNHRIPTDQLAVVTDVDIGADNEIRRRAGRTLVTAGHHHHLHQGASFMLATNEYGDLFKVGGGILRASLSGGRVWYLNLPDGRTAFSDGLQSGITDGATTTEWGVPLPPSIGSLTSVSGELAPGDYQYALTYVRLVDGLEGGPEYSNPIAVPDGGVLLTGLPAQAGYAINVYLSSQNGGEMYLAGTTLTSSFSYLGKSSALTLPVRTDFLHPMPVGTVSAFWRGRALVAQGNTLWASMPQQWELCDKRRDFKQFSAPITLVQPVDDGIYVGTEHELAYLQGTEFDKLKYEQKVQGPVVLGSGASAKAEQLDGYENSGRGTAMIGIADGLVVFGFAGGVVKRVTEGRYRTDVTEVYSTFRLKDGVPQYVAVPA